MADRCNCVGELLLLPDRSGRRIRADVYLPSGTDLKVIKSAIPASPRALVIFLHGAGLHAFRTRAAVNGRGRFYFYLGFLYFHFCFLFFIPVSLSIFTFHVLPLIHDRELRETELG